jgi:hypothetical protein
MHATPPTSLKGRNESSMSDPEWTSLAQAPTEGVVRSNFVDWCSKTFTQPIYETCVQFENYL